jgi:hypothetical protein
VLAIAAALGLLFDLDLSARLRHRFTEWPFAIVSFFLLAFQPAVALLLAALKRGFR